MIHDGLITQMDLDALWAMDRSRDPGRAIQTMAEAWQEKTTQAYAALAKASKANDEIVEKYAAAQEGLAEFAILQAELDAIVEQLGKGDLSGRPGAGQRHKGR